MERIHMDRTAIPTKLTWCFGCNTYFTPGGIRKHAKYAMSRARGENKEKDWKRGNRYLFGKGTRCKCGDVYHVPWKARDSKKWKEKGSYVRRKNSFYYRCIFCGHVADVTDTGFLLGGQFCVWCPSCGAHVMAYPQWQYHETLNLEKGLSESVIEKLRGERGDVTTEPRY